MTIKIALVTGGSRGLGKDMALSLAKKGIDVILTYNTKKAEAEKVVSQIGRSGRKAVALKSDVSDIKSIDNFISELLLSLQTNWNINKFDYLINNAGIGATLPIPQVTVEAFDNLMNIHFKGVYFLTQKSLPNMNDNGGVVLISSGTTRFCVPGYSLYSSLKGAVGSIHKVCRKRIWPAWHTCERSCAGSD